MSQENLSVLSLWERERTRRLLMLRVISQVGFVISLIFLSVFAFTRRFEEARFLGTVLILILLGIVWFLARQGRLELGSHLLLSGAIALFTLIGIDTGKSGTSPYFLFVMIVSSALLLSARWSFLYAAYATLSALAIYLFAPAGAPTFIGPIIGYVGAYSLTAVLVFLVSRSHDRVVESLVSQTMELQEIKASLEDRVRERTQELQTALDNIQRSSEVIRQLSVPVLPVADGVLVLPLIGNMDPERVQFIREQLLAQVYHQRARTLIIDLTALGNVDSYTVSALLELITAIRFLGAEPVLVGIRSEIAQAMVKLGVVLEKVVTRRDLRSGLLYALNPKAS